MNIDRLLLESIRKCFFKGKAIIVVGPRQVGKTTLMKILQKEFHEQETVFLNCDEPDTAALLKKVTSTELKNLIGHKKIVFIDEAQRIENIGITLKLIIDNVNDIQLVVSSSSSLDIRNRINEPLTGRKFEYNLYPFSTAELINSTSLTEEKRLIEQRLLYGMYPDIVNNPSEARRLLMELSSSYLYKDILIYKDIRNPEAITKLLTALALQLGSELSYNELANTIGVSCETVEKYIDLLEKVFIVFKLISFSRNLRNEMKKSRKIYFYDNGIRNAIIRNFQPLELRNDIGQLWENFCVSERKKRNEYNEIFTNTYFWRTHAQQEIDYIEERDGQLFVFELKWNEKKQVKIPKSFANAYPNHTFSVINRSNYLDFVL
ncbi:MAG: ATP-binding protein [Bacteroidales bacterium]|jgi:predicted AAA+ superfamily ATPase|nr:ATP-binding protein [Bacteroidales bacterium]